MVVSYKNTKEVGQILRTFQLLNSPKTSIMTSETFSLYAYIYNFTPPIILKKKCISFVVLLLSHKLFLLHEIFSILNKFSQT